jgi:Leucine Rich Repeat (LRR) protein
VLADAEQPEANSPGKRARAARKWYHLRWQVLLLIPLGLLIVAAFFVPRQIRQQRAIAALKQRNAVVRTQPVSLLGAELLVPSAYADEIVEVYWRDPALDDRQLSILEGLHSVEKLELSGSKVTSQGLVHLVGLSKLYMLHLDSTQVGDDGLVHLNRLGGLGVLSLDHTHVTDAGLAQLARLPHLERLYLNGTAITDVGLSHLAKLSKLKELSLVETQISDAGLVHLKGLKELEMLKVHDTRVTQQGMNELHAALPKCVIWVPSP